MKHVKFRIIHPLLIEFDQDTGYVHPCTQMITTYAVIGMIKILKESVSRVLIYFKG